MARKEKGERKEEKEKKKEKGEKIGKQTETLEEYTKYEIARIIAARALQLSMNAPILLKMSKEELEEIGYDPIKIAEKEFKAGVLPITVIRPMPIKLPTAIEEEKLVEKIEAPTPKEEEESIKEQERTEETVEEMYAPLVGEEVEEEEEVEKEEGFEG